MIVASDTNEFMHVEAEMMSAVGRFMPGSEGIQHWLRETLLRANRRRRVTVDELPENLRRDVGLEAASDLQRGMETSQRRLLDRMRLGSM